MMPTRLLSPADAAITTPGRSAIDTINTTGVRLLIPTVTI